jgi:hypothetical protein
MAQALLLCGARPARLSCNGSSKEDIQTLPLGGSAMKRSYKTKWMITVCFAAMLAVLTATAWAAEKIITGEVNDNYQIVTAGQIYEIADTPAGNDLAENHISAKVKVVGTVEVRDDMKIITVQSYQVLSE